MDFKNLTFITDAYSPKHIEETEKFLFLNRLKKRVRYVLKIMNYILLIGVGFFFVYPFAWMASMSLRPLIEALSFSPRLIVDNPQWSNYLYAWNQAQISHYVGNSIKYSLLVMGLQYLAIIPAAYAFATMEFKGKKFLWATKYLGMMLPGEATLIPVYFFYSKMGLVDTWGGLILPSLFSMFGIYMFMNAFQQVPREIIESARMDKAKNRTIMLKIMLPMVAPVLVTHLITSFISNWNEYYWVLVMTNSETIRTLPVALRGLLQVDDAVPQWNVVMAGTMIQLAPVLLMYIFASGKVKTALVGSARNKG
ncbi:MAG TPA: sugar ABC transporter permease [Ruminococcaceae bacterium]|jgi:sn-glycerol 3-phosphate transport system permease protein|nr:sugar ABC transporter permease [Ruminiclostridium sp.]HBT63379.1 sugar ABC transporter permease [Oscillospiraceae bacterium]